MCSSDLWKPVLQGAVMRRVAWIALFVLTACAGCKKTGNKPEPTKPEVQASGGGGGPNIINQSGNLTVRGGEGAIQAPRMAAARIANEAELKDLHLAIFQAMQLDPNEQPPGPDEMKEILRQNSKLAAHVKDEIVILTGTRQKDGIFAYTQWPQRAEKHYVVTRQGVEVMTPEDLKTQLEAQKSTVKLSR